MNLALITIAIVTIVGLKPPTSLFNKAEVSVPPKAAEVVMPVRQPGSELFVGARAAYAVDATTGTVLYAKNEKTALPIASLTKIMTMLAILRDHKPEEMVTIPQLGPYKQGDALAYLVKDDQVSVKDLVAASLVPSSNDAADALAIYDSETKEKFYGKMNSIAQEWGLSNAHFASASGLTDTNNQASAQDIATAARLGLKNPLFKELISKKRVEFTSQQGRVYQLNTTNQLLDGKRVIGLKTGYTPMAGECFVSLSKVNGHDIITVVLGSRDRFGETTRILNWLEQTYSWHTIN